MSPTDHFSPEVFTSDPWELAEQTLHSVLEFSTVLGSLSIDSGSRIGKPDFFDTFKKLIDGIDLFTQALSSVKRILKSGVPQTMEALESDLLLLLQDLLRSQQVADSLLLKGVLCDELPRNLKQWKEGVIPTLLRSRDC